MKSRQSLLHSESARVVDHQVIRVEDNFGQVPSPLNLAENSFSKAEKKEGILDSYLASPVVWKKERNSTTPSLMLV